MSEMAPGTPYTPHLVADHPAPLGDLAQIFLDRRIAVGIDFDGQVVLARPDSVLVDDGGTDERRRAIAEVVRTFDNDQANLIERGEADRVLDVVEIKLDVTDATQINNEDRWSLRRADDLLAQFAEAKIAAELNHVALGSQTIIGSPLGAQAHWAGEMAFTGRTAKGADDRTVMLTTAEPATRPRDLRARLSIAKHKRPRVLVLDTGLRTDGAGKAEHTELTCCEVAPYYSRSTVEGVIDDEDEIDDNRNDLLDFEAGHGTFISGIIRQICPDAEIYTAGVLSSFGDGPVFGVLKTLKHVIDAIEPVDVVVMSFGASFANDDPGVFASRLTALLGNAVGVAAAGNQQTCRPYFPAGMSNVIAVGGLAADGKAWFTNFGGWVDACAPAIDVVSTFFNTVTELIDGKEFRTFEKWARWSGTSFSAPKVAALIAQEMYLNKITAREAWKRMISHKHFRYPDLGIVFNV